MVEVACSEGNGLKMSKEDVRKVVNIRAKALGSLELMKEGLSDIEQAELDGMIDAVKGMYNPYEYLEVQLWQPQNRTQ